MYDPFASYQPEAPVARPELGEDEGARLEVVAKAVLNLSQVTPEVA